MIEPTNVPTRVAFIEKITVIELFKYFENHFPKFASPGFFTMFTEFHKVSTMVSFKSF